MHGILEIYSLQTGCDYTAAKIAEAARKVSVKYPDYT
jgi:hypothetical protein